MQIPTAGQTISPIAFSEGLYQYSLPIFSGSILFYHLLFPLVLLCLKPLSPLKIHVNLRLFKSSDFVIS